MCAMQHTQMAVNYGVFVCLSWFTEAVRDLSQ